MVFHSSGKYHPLDTLDTLDPGVGQGKVVLVFPEKRGPQPKVKEEKKKISHKAVPPGSPVVATGEFG